MLAHWQKPQGSCLHPPSTGTVSMCHHTHWLFLWVLGIKVKSSYLCSKHCPDSATSLISKFSSFQQHAKYLSVGSLLCFQNFDCPLTQHIYAEHSPLHQSFCKHLNFQTNCYSVAIFQETPIWQFRYTKENRCGVCLNEGDQVLKKRGTAVHKVARINAKEDFFF